MSVKHPVIAVTGSSGAGTTTVKLAFEHLFRRMNLKPAIVEGDSFHKYDRNSMKEFIKQHESDRYPPSHFGEDANLFDKLEELFKAYGERGEGEVRKYLHNEEEAAPYGQDPGTFTPWEPIEKGSDLMFYEGLHGGVVTEKSNVAQHVDLLIGVVPIVNLEWIQKIHRDTHARGYDTAAVTDTILRRMYDYVHYITPQFSRTDINFQRVSIVDTSNPFIARDIPTPDESLAVIRFRGEYAKKADFSNLLRMLHLSWMSRPNTLVVPGGKMGMAIEMILPSLIEELMEKKRQA